MQIVCKMKELGKICGSTISQYINLTHLPLQGAFIFTSNGKCTNERRKKKENFELGFVEGNSRNLLKQKNGKFKLTSWISYITNVTGQLVHQVA